jgi:hypothetical protein
LEQITSPNPQIADDHTDNVCLLLYIFRHSGGVIYKWRLKLDMELTIAIDSYAVVLGISAVINVNGFRNGHRARNILVVPYI